MGKGAVIKWGWLRAVIGLVAGYLVVDNSVYLPRLITQLFDVRLDKLCFAINNMIFSILVVYLFRRYIDRKSFISLGFAINGFKKDILVGFFSPFMLMGTGFMILYFLGQIEITSFNLNFGMLIYWAIGLFFAAAVEEVPLRGYMLNNMMESMNNYIAVGIISVIFGLLHALGQHVSMIGIINCTLLGMLVGLYYVHKRNIWMPIVFHAGWNYFQGTIFGSKVSGRLFDYSLLTTNVSGNELATGGDYGFEGSLILTVLTILAIVIFQMKNLKREVRTGEADRRSLFSTPDGQGQ